MTVVCGHDEAISQWVAERIPHVGEGGFGPCAALAVVGRDKVLAGVVYHDYQPDHGTIQLSMAADSPMWAKRSNIKALLSYPFEQLGVFKVWTATPIDNTRAIVVNEHIGLKREATLAHHFGHKRHAVICRMLRPEYTRLYGDS